MNVSCQRLTDMSVVRKREREREVVGVLRFFPSFPFRIGKVILAGWERMENGVGK